MAYFQPRRVILFGSAAQGQAGPDSDIDLLVVLDDDAPQDKLTIRAGHEARLPYRRPADVIPCRESTFRRQARVAGTLAYEAAHAGVVVYERP
ncbi:MAG TPA: nucleotidyltransferase domain-containing protein [Acetobacteraceae bacterium]|nr:nucleotidyltransferase domain-containing protein [Acetobacteraceae bacterium]